MPCCSPTCKSLQAVTSCLYARTRSSGQAFLLICCCICFTWHPHCLRELGVQWYFYTTLHNSAKQLKKTDRNSSNFIYLFQISIRSNSCSGKLYFSWSLLIDLYRYECIIIYRPLFPFAQSNINDYAWFILIYIMGLIDVKSKLSKLKLIWSRCLFNG